MEDYDSAEFDSDSYVEVPQGHREPSVHQAPSIHGRIVPAVHRDNHFNGPYEPSVHNFGVHPSADEYSDVGSPISSSMASPQFPMGGYSGRDMMHDPVHLNPPTILRTESEDSRDYPQYMGDGRKHPDFRQPPSQVSELLLGHQFDHLCIE